MSIRNTLVENAKGEGILNRLEGLGLPDVLQSYLMYQTGELEELDRMEAAFTESSETIVLG